MEGGRIVSVSLPVDESRVARLEAVMAGDKNITGEVSDAVKFVLAENMDMARQISPLAGQNVPFGVPSFIVPRPDGTATFVRGWDKSTTINEIIDAYEGDE